MPQWRGGGEVDNGHAMKNPPTSESYGFNTRRAHRAFDRLLHAHLTPHDLKAGYWYYLRVLWSRDGLSQKELSTLNNVAENTTTAMINGMVRDGFVTRTRDPEDKRKWAVRLTPRAIALRTEVLPYAEKVNAIAARGIPKEELATCLSVLKRMSANLEDAFQALESGAKR